jgi:hypothetical protein
MVAYSFKARFADPILRGDKRQTIRAHRKRHARPGEELQLYTGMRTKHCRLIGHAICERIEPIIIDVAGGAVHFPRSTETINGDELDAFAVRDGFQDWEDMRAFWRAEHPSIAVFEGVVIRWRELLAEHR